MSTTIINYDAVVQELIKGIQINDNHDMAPRLGLDKTDWRYYSELRTVGFSVPRQLGASGWLVNQFIRHPLGEALVVVANRPMRQLFLTRLDERDAFKHSRPHVIVADKTNLANLHHTYRYVYIEDASHVFANQIKHAPFHRALAPHVTENVVIVRVN
jgi:hypothetical protein